MFGPSVWLLKFFLTFFSTGSLTFLHVSFRWREAVMAEEGTEPVRLSLFPESLCTGPAKRGYMKKNNNK